MRYLTDEADHGQDGLALPRAAKPTAPSNQGAARRMRAPADPEELLAKLETMDLAGRPRANTDHAEAVLLLSEAILSREKARCCLAAAKLVEKALDEIAAGPPQVSPVATVALRRSSDALAICAKGRNAVFETAEALRRPGRGSALARAFAVAEGQAAPPPAVVTRIAHWLRNGIWRLRRQRKEESVQVPPGR